MKILMIASLTILLAGCSSLGLQPKPVEVAVKPTDRPRLIVPAVDVIDTRDVTWIVVTPENVEQVFQDLQDSGDSIVLFALTDRGYENLSLNMAEITRLIRQQQSIIAAYRQYYENQQE